MIKTDKRKKEVNVTTADIAESAVFSMPEEQHEYVPKLSEILETDVDEKYYISDEKAQTIIRQALEKLEKLGKIHAVLTPDRMNKRQNGRRAKLDDEEMFTLTAQDIHGVILQLSHGYNAGGLHSVAPTLTGLSYQENNFVLEVQKALKNEICKVSGLLNPNGCSKTLRVSGDGSLSKKHNYQHVLVDLHGTAADPSQLARKGRYLIHDNIAPTLCARDYKEPRLVVVGKLDINSKDQTKRVYSADGISPTLTTCCGGYQEVKIFEPKYYRVRKLTPTEYGRLQAFPMDRWEQVVSNSQAYKQFGNSVTVTVVTVIAEHIKNFLETREVTK